MSKLAVVSGSNKGIGFAIARSLASNSDITVLVTSRDTNLGKNAVSELKKENSNAKLDYHPLDIADQKEGGSIDQLASYIKDKFGGIDILVNNAGIAFKGDAFDEHVASTTINTNYWGTLRVCEKLLPLMKEGGRVVNVSSRAGNFKNLRDDLRAEFTDKNLTVSGTGDLMNRFVKDVREGTWQKNGWPKSTYGVSKVGLTTVTRVLANDKRWTDKKVLINACCPGWVKTDMAGDKAPLTPDQGAETPVFLALSPSVTQTGLFFCDKAVFNIQG